MRYKLSALIIIAAIGAYLMYNYIYQDHRDISTEIAAYTMSSEVLNKAFKDNLTTAEQNYLNETINVSGTITDIEDFNITLNDKVFCQFKNAMQSTLKLNTNLTIKGRVIGYDDLLEQVKLDQCIINKN